MLEFNSLQSLIFVFANVTINLVETRVEVGVEKATIESPIIRSLGILTKTFFILLQTSLF